MRGEPNQTPMLIQIAGDSSTSESEGPPTPESSTSDGQAGMVQHQGDDDGSLDVDFQTASQHVRMDEKKGRGRKGLTIDTGSGREAHNMEDPSVHIERARSPYSHRPPPRGDTKPQPAVQVLSPQPINSPGCETPRALEPHLLPKSHQVGLVGGSHAGNVKQAGGGHATNGPPDPASSGLKRPLRPVLERRASAMPQLGTCSSATAARARYVENSSDESDRELYTKLRARSGQLTSDALPRAEAGSYFDSPPRQHERSHTRAAMDPNNPYTEHATGTYFNRDSLLNGPALQHLSTVLEGQHQHQRLASPRASPQVSPQASRSGTPTPSPPQTPAIRNHKRSSTVEIYQNNSPTAARYSSPASSRPSSPKPGLQNLPARPHEHDKPRTMTSAHRRTSSGSAQMVLPQSLTSYRYDRSGSYSSQDAREQTGRKASYASDSTKEPTMLQPKRIDQRHRKPSSEDLRKALPLISTKEAVLHQDFDALKSPRSKSRSGPYVPVTAGATLGANLADGGGKSHRSRSIAPENPSNHRHRSRSRAASDAKAVRSSSVNPRKTKPCSDQDDLMFLPACPRPEPVSGYDDWYCLEQNTSMLICPNCRNGIFGRDYERAFYRAAEPKRGQKVHCAMNNPWIRLASMASFQNKRPNLRDLRDLTDISYEEPPCPKSTPSSECYWYHLRDSETSRTFADFQVCSHCVYSLELLYPGLGDIFHATSNGKDAKKGQLKDKEPHVCSLRSDEARFGKYLDSLINMDESARKSKSKPSTSDFIWEIKWLTIISPCNGAAVHYGQDMHCHPDCPELTICEECYYKTVRPALKSISRRDTRHFARGIGYEAKEIVGPSTCKLYSARMKQLFREAVEDDDFEYLKKAVEKRHLLLKDLEEARMALAKKPHEEKLKGDVEYFEGKLEKLGRRH